jgi:hypothetical protein
MAYLGGSLLDHEERRVEAFAISSRLVTAARLITTQASSKI